MTARNGRSEAHNESYTTTDWSFDSLAKGLSKDTLGRRDALKLVGGAVLGGLLASIPGVAWAAKGGGAAQGRCPEGFVNCRGKCVILAEDRNNCGGCAIVCPEGRVCNNGTCCQQGQVCGDTCCPTGQSCWDEVCCPIEQQCRVFDSSTTSTLMVCCPPGTICRESENLGCVAA